MKTAKHTPAPWRAIAPGIGHTAHRDKRIMVLHPDGLRLICQLDTGYCRPDGEEITENERIANARLIAAAPELLEALQELMRCSVAQEKSELPDERSFWQSVGMARAAIAKARGAEQ